MLREPEKYAEAYASEYERAARVFADAHELGMSDVLGNRDHFEMAKRRPSMLNANCQKEARETLEEVKRAEYALEEWFKLTEEFRRFCISYVSDGEGEEDGQSD